MGEFGSELDAYERQVAKRVGATAAGESRCELEAHLAADYEARLEFGVEPQEARAQGMAALGDLRVVARGEGPNPHRWMLLLPPPLFVAWCLAVSRTGAEIVQNGPFLACVGFVVFGSLRLRRIDVRSAFISSSLATVVGTVWTLSHPPAHGTPLASIIPMVQGVTGNFAILFAAHVGLQSVGMGLAILARRGRVRRVTP